MVTVKNSFYREYEELLIKNDELSQEVRKLKYNENLLLNQIKTLESKEKQADEEKNEFENILKEKDYEIARLKALLNMDGTNHGIPTSMTPIHKKKVIPNTREKSDKPKGGQVGHQQHKLKKFKDEEVTEKIKHSMEECPCCKSHEIKTTGEIKEKDELDYKIVVVKRRHQFIEYECKECGKKFHEDIPTNLKEENQYGPEVQALELTLMNEANVTINKAQKITYGMTNGELKKFEDKFEKIMITAHKENEEEQQKYYVDKEATLMLRILDYKNEYLLWIYDFDVPFTNNLSERGLRGAKSKMKAAGQFWNVESASWYATIRTYIEKCNRNNVNIYNALLKLSIGKPYTLKQILEHNVD